MEIQELEFFTKNLWLELNRYDLRGKLLHTVTCTEDNLCNLFNSQFSEITKYGNTYRYSI